MIKENRILDYTKPVYVYKNLHKDCWSIKQNGLVVAYLDEVFLEKVEMVVSIKGRDRVINEQRKNVHAFLKGFIISVNNASKLFSYNPYKFGYFYDKITYEPIKTAYHVKLNSLAYYGDSYDR